MSLEFEEKDEAGTVVATYITSSKGTDASTWRVDMLVRLYSLHLRSFSDYLWTLQPRGKRISLWLQALNVFLPAGYPHSVTKDYME
jgi:hypothetical protein